MKRSGVSQALRDEAGRRAAPATFGRLARLPAGRDPEGQTRVIVNLDTLEYIDPVKFGQAPTLAGMVASRRKTAIFQS